MNRRSFIRGLLSGTCVIPIAGLAPALIATLPSSREFAWHRLALAQQNFDAALRLAQDDKLDNIIGCARDLLDAARYLYSAGPRS